MKTGLAALLILALFSVCPAFGSECTNLTSETDLTEFISCINALRSRIVDLEKDDGLRSVPIGSVVPFFLPPDKLANLKPRWLPADGRQVDDRKSELFGEYLPNLVDRFPLGAHAEKNIFAAKDKKDEEYIEGGRLSETELKTGGALFFDKREKVEEVKWEEKRFTIDTEVKEITSARHKHAISDIKYPYPPFRRLVYMVRVR
ncbi:MAG: hypothetical protein SWE60_06115 [Thermodesulfobacteriota bacterium]|nr:hypothetical protein [Thermodesulfobacteriota bacterium]